MSIQESNKLIAEFMGGKLHLVYDGHWHFPTPPEFEGSLNWSVLHYHEAWDWIMPVIEKIQGLQKGRFHFSIDPWSFMLVDYKEQEKEIFTYQFDADDPLIFRYYQSVIGFIEWYNSQQSNTTP